MFDQIFDGATWVRVLEDGTRIVVNGHAPISPLRDQRERIYERDGRQCVWCYATENLSIDHRLPKSQGGRAFDHNLQVLCVPCNADKGDGPDEITPSALRRRAQNIKRAAQEKLRH